jgi:hypothetical protein
VIKESVNNWKDIVVAYFRVLFLTWINWRKPQNILPVPMNVSAQKQFVIPKNQLPPPPLLLVPEPPPPPPPPPLLPLLPLPSIIMIIIIKVKR